MRRTLLVIGVLMAFTIQDLIQNGLTPIDVLSIMIQGFFAVAIVGALRQPPQE
jgi:hypothetical protein